VLFIPSNILSTNSVAFCPDPGLHWGSATSRSRGGYTPQPLTNTAVGWKDKCLLVMGKDASSRLYNYLYSYIQLLSCKRD